MLLRQQLLLLWAVVVVVVLRLLLLLAVELAQERAVVVPELPDWPSLMTEPSLY